jgi:hypothetical protein
MKKFLLAILLSVLFSDSFCQVTAGFFYSDYYDINPDTLLHYVVTPYTNQTFDINMFGDANSDMEFTAHGAISSGGSDAYIKVTCLNPEISVSMERLDSVFVPGESNWNITKVAKTLGSGDTIDALDAVWENNDLYLTDHSGHSGGNKNVNDWVGGEKFLGVKYMDINGISYGWIRVKCPNEDSCYVKDYSFTPLISGINKRGKNDLAIYPNPMTGSFYLKNISISNLETKNLRLRDIYGNDVQFSFEVNSNNLRIGTDPTLPAGFYFLEYVSGERSFSEKVIKMY